MRTIRERTAALAVITAIAIGVVPGGKVPLRAQGPNEGIKVHGHWTIEIRQPDGSLVTHREFENALDQSSGSFSLARFLARVWSPGEWLVALAGAEGTE